MATVKVDRERCQNYGQCIFEAPAVFRFDQEDRLEYEPEPSDEDRDRIEAAAEVCPMQAISIADS